MVAAFAKIDLTSPPLSKRHQNPRPTSPEATSQNLRTNMQINDGTPEPSTIQADLLTTEPTDEEVQEKPWKYVGYRRYAEFISSDDDFFVLRRFHTLNVRVALAYQDKLSMLEQQLSEMDNRHSRRQAPDVNNGTLRGDLDEREALLDETSEAVYRYSLQTCAH
jgi:hypothetical protein